MYIFFAPLLFLPLIEIIGFITIGGHLGFGLSILWIIGATWLGFYILQQRGRSSLDRALRAQDDELFAVQDIFDGVCYVIAALLLIFPGFISDFIAIPFLLAPMRHWMFGHISKNPEGVAGKFMREGQRFGKSRTTTMKSSSSTTTIIEGEFKKIDEE